MDVLNGSPLSSNACILTPPKTGHKAFKIQSGLHYIDCMTTTSAVLLLYLNRVLRSPNMPTPNCIPLAERCCDTLVCLHLSACSSIYDLSFPDKSATKPLANGMKFGVDLADTWIPCLPACRLDENPMKRSSRGESLYSEPSELLHRETPSSTRHQTPSASRHQTPSSARHFVRANRSRLEIWGDLLIHGHC